MKKEKNSSIKAQLVRRASLSLLLVAVCIIPFARGQRNVVRTATAQIKRNAVAHAPQITNVFGRAPVVSKKGPIAPFLLSGPLGGTCPSTIDSVQPVELKLHRNAAALDDHFLKRAGACVRRFLFGLSCIIPRAVPEKQQ